MSVIQLSVSVFRTDVGNLLPDTSGLIIDVGYADLYLLSGSNSRRLISDVGYLIAVVHNNNSPFPMSVI